MKLYLDTSQEKTVLKLDSKKVEFSAIDKNKKQQILIEIDKFLTRENKKISDISEIEVNPGPGPFTSIRVGVAIANALGNALGVPIINSVTKKRGTVAVAYDRPANVTKGKG